jgi:hypothetical protein
MFERSISRRHFVSAIPLTVLATPRSLRGGASSDFSDRGDTSCDLCQQVQTPGFAGPFTEAEARAVAASPLAQGIATLQGGGYPCSELILLAALRRFQLPENHLNAAAVFGGGVGKRDLCGFLTGGLMAIGFAAGEKYADRATMHRAGRAASNAYWDWWLTRGDLHCMGPGTTHGDSGEFLRMSQRAAVKLEEVILSL